MKLLELINTLNTLRYDNSPSYKVIQSKQKELLDKNPRFLEKMFTSKEIEYFESKSFKAETIAGNFAAKEAISKSIGTGIRKFNLRDIEVLRDELGKPIVKTYNILRVGSVVSTLPFTFN